MNKVSSVQWNQIWRNFKSIWAFRKVNLEFGKLLRQLWYFYATGQIVIVVNDQRLKNNKVIWSHWFCFLIATYLPQRQLYTWTLQYLIITFQMCLTRKGFIYNDPSWCISAKLITVCFSVCFFSLIFFEIRDFNWWSETISFLLWVCCGSCAKKL